MIPLGDCDSKVRILASLFAPMSPLDCDCPEANAMILTSAKIAFI